MSCRGRLVLPAGQRLHPNTSAAPIATSPCGECQGLAEVQCWRMSFRLPTPTGRFPSLTRSPSMRCLNALLLAAFGVLAPAAKADVKPNPLFSDNMVLQRNASVPVWGTADPGE